MHFKSLCLIVTLVFSVSALYVPSAKAEGWLDFLFPSGPKGPSPAETLRAPFANEDSVIEEMDASGSAANRTPLHLRHRTNAIMTRWVQQNVPIMLSYRSEGYEKQYQEKILSFSRVGSEEYVKFLQKRNFLTTLKTGRYDITGFIQDYPVILNEGAAEGSYRWVYQINVMVTYIQSGAKDYKDLKDGDSISQEFVVTFQLGRSREATNEHGVLIETWDVKPKQKT